MDRQPRILLATDAHETAHDALVIPDIELDRGVFQGCMGNGIAGVYHGRELRFRAGQFFFIHRRARKVQFMKPRRSGRIRDLGRWIIRTIALPVPARSEGQEQCRSEQQGKGSLHPAFLEGVHGVVDR